jgi:hypothetical protein
MKYRLASNNKTMARSVPDDIVRAIRDIRIKEGRSYREIAALYRINIRMVSDICTRKTYKDVE